MSSELDPTPAETVQPNVVVGASPPGDTNELVMAWARERATGTMRYILELGEHQRGAHCGCDCISCGQPLTAVNAAKATYRRRPHFRHPAGSLKEGCLVLTAREAIRAALRPGALIFLPRRRRSAQFQGLSGQAYEAWVEQPPERVQIASVEFRDGIKALLELDDGRKLEVQLVGSADVSDATPLGIVPRIQIAVDDPMIAAMAPEEIRRRLVPLFDQATWCGHWLDADLESQAAEAAHLAAEDALDWESHHPELPPELRRESLLHREVKAILEQTGRLRVPGWNLQVDNGTGSGLRRQASAPEKTAYLLGARLEQRLGRIIPDVVAQLREGGELLIEVTVTNHVTEERLARIREVNLPTLEIDMSRFGGRITRKQLTDIVVDDVAGKVWLHHPVMEERRRALQAELEAEARAETERQAEHERRRKAILDVPLESWIQRFLSAADRHALLRWTEGGNDDDKAAAEAELATSASALAELGYAEAMDQRLYSGLGGGLVPRLLAIQHNRDPRGGEDGAWPVIQTILHEHADSQRTWHSLYLIAVKAYRPALMDSEATEVDQWREQVKRSIQSGEPTYLRDPYFDRLLGVLFPAMREALGHAFGKRPSHGGALQQDNAGPDIASPAAMRSRVPAQVDPGPDYFDGDNEQRWMWALSKQECYDAARRERIALRITGVWPETPRLTKTLDALQMSTTTSDPWRFALLLEHTYQFPKKDTLRYLFTLGWITPLRRL